MKKITLFFILITSLNYGQVTITPNPFDVDQSITITIDANSTASDSNGFSNPTKVYMHSGVGPNTNPWTYTVGNWGTDDGVGEMTNNNDGTWSITLTPETYYNLTSAQASTITKMGLVFRNENGSQEFKDNGNTDFFFNVGLFQVELTAPTQDITTLTSGQNLSITATSSQAADFVLKANGTTINTSNNTTSYNFSHTVNENIDYILQVTKGSDVITKTFHAIVSITEQSVPANMKDGINLDANDATKATLVLYAPTKNTVHLIGDFNNWQVNNTYLLKKDTGKDRFWIELTGLTPQTNHMYQYVVDGNMSIADPYSTIVLSESNDQYINNITYPDLPQYPTGKTSHAVTLLRTGDTPYTWQTTNFQKPEKTDLVIYELLIRDFDNLHSYDAVKARLDYLQNLGINAIEFMPVMEFDGNESWGYNPSFHMALDKYYGNTTSFKQLIDECHARGIAVIIDVAFNHASGQNPYYRMWNTDNGGYGGQPSADSPYFNQTATHSYSVFNDFNHSKQAVKDYVKRVSQYWIDEYKIDGFRWDLTKGFTQNCSSSDESCTGNYQADRVAVLKEYADYQWEKDPNFYVIFEHLGGNIEEKEWSEYRLGEGKGILLWGNHNHQYNQNTMGFSSDSDFSWISYKNRGWSVPANVSYMESHDEQRLMYKNIQFGNSNGGYNVKTLTTALARQKIAGAFYFTIPGPKMIWQFGELGYDIDIDHQGRTGNKPVLWNYFDDPNRKELYNTWSKLIQLKLKYDIFKTSDFTLDVGSSNNGIKKIHLTDPTATDIQSVVIIGNFGVITQSITPNFQQTGTWYNLLDDNSTITVSSTTALISLAPGEFKVYGNKPAVLATEDLVLDVNFMKLFPNPSSDTFFINTEVQKVQIFDVTGKLVKKFVGNFTKNHAFDIQQLDKGIYVVNIKNTEMSTTKRFIKR